MTLPILRRTKLHFLGIIKTSCKKTRLEVQTNIKAAISSQFYTFKVEIDIFNLHKVTVLWKRLTNVIMPFLSIF